jgi:DNA-binding transcriptional MerR regulator
MEHLTKIRDMSSKYDVSARTLRYYEDMGLITSIRSDDYAYRLYDEAAAKKLEQILILRKLNISIKDIQRIFNASGSETVLDVLGKKVYDIDGEVALLHELKGFILEFIRQIKQADFTKDDDVKMLYEKAKDIETQLVQVREAPAHDAGRLVEIARQIDGKIPGIMVVKLPGFKAVSSGSEVEAHGDAFWDWADAHTHLFKDIVWDNGEFYLPKDTVIRAVHDHVSAKDTAPYEIITVEGGLYATVVCVNMDDESMTGLSGKIVKWLEGTNFTKDEARDGMAHLLFPHSDVKLGLGYHQMQLYMPIKFDAGGWQSVYSLATDKYIQGIERGATWQGFETKRIAPTGSPDYTFCEVEGRNAIQLTKRANDWDGVNVHLDNMGLTLNHYCSIEVRGRITGDLEKFAKGSVELTALPGYDNMAYHAVADGASFTLAHVFPIMKDKVIPRARISTGHTARKMPFVIEQIEVKVKPFEENPNYTVDTRPLHDVAELKAFEVVYNGTDFARIDGMSPQPQAVISVPAGKYMRVHMPPGCVDAESFRTEIHEKYLYGWLQGGAGHTFTGAVEFMHENVLLLSIAQNEVQNE